MPDASELPNQKELGGLLKRKSLNFTSRLAFVPEALARAPHSTRGFAIGFHSTKINNYFFHDHSLSQNNLTLERNLEFLLGKIHKRQSESLP
jgi:hypothetical protein